MSWGVMGWGVMEQGWRKGPWTAEEDKLLLEYVRLHGEGRWNSVSRLSGLKRNGKSCRLRWVNYLRPDLKKGQITPNEERIILELHARWGNRWSTIARSLPGRTDNEIKNYWRTHFKKGTKSSSENSEKTKNRLLRRQQFQQQQRLQLRHHENQQEQLKLQFSSQLDIKKIMSLLDEQGESNINKEVPHVPEMRQDMATSSSMYLNEDQLQECYYPSGSGYAPMMTVPEARSENMLWDGLWNLDEGFGNFGAAVCATKKPLFQNLVTPYC